MDHTPPPAGTCRMADRCHTRDHKQNPGPDDGRGFCWPDERHGQHAITELPANWLALTERLGKDAGRQGLGGIPTNQAEAPIPLHLHLDALARRIAWTLDTWATSVRERARLSEDPRAYQHQWQQRTRPGYAVQRDAGTLATHYSVLLALGPVDYLDYDTATPTDGDGPAAIVALITLHHQARAALGVTRRRERRDLPCPLPPAGTPDAERRLWGCGLADLGEWLGSGQRWYDSTAGVWMTGPNVVDCGNCGWTCTADEYAAYAMTFVPPDVKVAA